MYIAFFLKYHVMGEGITPKFRREISALSQKFTYEITDLPWQPSVRLSAKKVTKIKGH